MPARADRQHEPIKRVVSSGNGARACHRFKEYLIFREGVIHNTYYDNSIGIWQELDVFNPPELNEGKDFYVDVFKEIESRGLLTNRKFYISGSVPDTLPAYSSNVILLVVSDERHTYRPYFSSIGCILHTYGALPYYKEGVPTSRAKLLSFLIYLYKLFGVVLGMIKCSLQTRDVRYYKVTNRILHVQLSCYYRFSPRYRVISERSVGYAFLGSVSQNSNKHRGVRRMIRSLFTHPKILSRLEMLQAMNSLKNSTLIEAKIFTTGDFAESIENRTNYVRTLENSKISLCPRGAMYETYRFFESLKAGCVVICQQLPNAWFYQGHPGIRISDWSVLPDLVTDLLSRPDYLQQLADEAVKLWHSVLSEAAVATRIAEFLRTREDELASTAVALHQD